MREAAKQVLEVWAERLDAQDEQGWEYEGYDVMLPDYLLGAAKFMKEVAFKINDREMLGTFTQVEMFLDKRMQQQELEVIAQDEAQDRKDNDQEEIRRLCARCFYKDSIFSVDMSGYMSVVESARNRFTDPYKLSSLISYLDADRVLARIYEKVKGDLYAAYATGGEMPDEEDVVQAFEVRRGYVFKLADAHVASTLAKYAPAV